MLLHIPRAFIHRPASWERQHAPYGPGKHTIIWFSMPEFHPISQESLSPSESLLPSPRMSKQSLSFPICIQPNSPSFIHWSRCHLQILTHRHFACTVQEAATDQASPYLHASAHTCVTPGFIIVFRIFTPFQQCWPVCLLMQMGELRVGKRACPDHLVS